MKCSNVFSRKKILLCFALAFSAAFTGCGAAEAPEEIELHEPEQVVMGTETVRLRNLYDAYVYEAAVYPYTEDYFFEENRTFSSYGAMAGESVARGTPLVYADMDSVRAQVEAEEETLQSLKEAHEDFCRETEENIAEWKEKQAFAEQVLENLEEQKPEEFIYVKLEETGDAPDAADGDEAGVPEEDGGANPGSEKMANPEYTKWLADKKKWEGEWALYGYYIDVAEEELRQRTELYNLDYAYHDSRRKELEEEQQRGIITSRMTGTVISMARYLPGDTVRQGNTVVTVGDLERKMVKCSAISNIAYLMSHAQEVYAFFGGRRYEIVYEENDTEGYSCFSFSEDVDVSVGDYGVIVLVMESRTQVPTLPAEAVYTDGVRNYVYVQEEGGTVVREVETGMSDGLYTEILSGVSEEEVVLLSQATAAVGNTTAVLERGTYGVSYSGSGTIYYPRKTLLRNPVENGTVLFQESLVAASQYVRKGDAVTAVYVEGDEQELLRLETELKRARERLADLVAEGVEGNENAIAQREEKIAQMEEKIAELRSDYAQTAIYATVSGVVDSRISPEEDTVIKPGEVVARISDIQAGYIILNTYLLNYGDVLTVTYRDWNGETRTTAGRVVTMGTLPVDGRYTVKDMIVALPQGEIAEVEAAQEIDAGRYSTNSVAVEGLVKTMENVVLVPRDAVTAEDGHTYVNVVGEDGSVTSVSFLAGGANTDYYWVLEGLTEGMKICWE